MAGLMMTACATGSARKPPAPVLKVTPREPVPRSAEPAATLAAGSAEEAADQGLCLSGSGPSPIPSRPRSRRRRGCGRERLRHRRHGKALAASDAGAPSPAADRRGSPRPKPPRPLPEASCVRGADAEVRTRPPESKPPPAAAPPAPIGRGTASTGSGRSRRHRPSAPLRRQQMHWRVKPSSSVSRVTMPGPRPRSSAPCGLPRARPTSGTGSPASVWSRARPRRPAISPRARTISRATRRRSSRTTGGSSPSPAPLRRCRRRDEAEQRASGN
jgi:hypothetical protein